MTSFYVSTGISLQESSRCWKGLEQWRAQSTADLLQEPASGDIFRTISAKREEILRSVHDRVSAEEATAEHFDPKCWDPAYRHTLPAELATLVLMNREGMVSSNDRVVFLAGETNQRVAWLLEALYKNAAALPNPTGSALGSVSGLGPYRWEPTTTDAFKAGMRRLWGDVASDPNGAFVLTGGYKAVLLDLALQLARIERSVSIFYLHEAGQQLVTLGIDAGQITTVTRTEHG